MITRRRMLPFVLLAAIVLIMGTIGSRLSADPEPIEYDDLDFFIEVNSTDGDAGIQLNLDGEQWKSLEIFTPGGEKLLDVTAELSLETQGLTEFFFESAEPSFEEVPLDEFLARFPAGDYIFEGVTIDGDPIAGMATLTHVIPDGPVIVFPQDGDTVEADDLEIEWEPVTGPAGVEIVSYEIIVESDEADGEFRVLLPPTATSVEVPEEIFDPEVSEYKWEILAKEASGNQTITETEFEVEFEEESEFTIFVSEFPDRSDAVELDEMTVSGDIYVYTDTGEEVASVSFFIDDELIRTERTAPHDMAGTVRGSGSGLDRDARPFDTDDLEDGEYELVVEIDPGDGGEIIELEADFEVDND